MIEAMRAARATMRFLRPLAVVRGHFFDVDRAIRDKIHHGAALRWVPGAGGAPRVEQTTRLLSCAVVDVFVIEEGDQGAWVKRIVEGPNEGARFVARFTADGDAATSVELEAFVGPGGYFAALGKLSTAGIQRAVETLLGEHRRALEGYEPGRARGAIGKVLEKMRALSSRVPSGDAGRAVMTNVLELACVIAIADGRADAPERDAMRTVARTLCHLELDEPAIARMVENVARAAASDGIEARCDKIGARLATLDAAELGLGVAALIAAVSHGIDVGELAALQRVGVAAGLAEAEVAALVAKIDAELG